MWAALEPLDRKLFRCDYSDVALLGKAVTRSRAWPLVGLALHAANGAVFGLVFDEVRRRTGERPVRLAVGMALTEHAALYPLFWFIDRDLFWSRRAYAQATARHLVFGLALGATA